MKIRIETQRYEKWRKDIRSRVEKGEAEKQAAGAFEGEEVADD